MVSHWLRRAGQIDPVNASLEEFEAFHVWVRERIRDEGVFSKAGLVIEIKRALARSRSLRKPLVLSRYFLIHPLLVARWTLERFTGSNLPKTLATVWTSKIDG